MDKKILALFPGQGSQKVGMGKDLYDKYEIAKDFFERADLALGFSLSEICFSGPEDKLTATEIAQPAILTVSIICFALCSEEIKNKIVVSAGHSLGEYSAYVASGALKFEDAVKLVNKRGKYMQSAVPSGKGKMLAVLGKEVSEIETVLSEIKNGVCEIANINSPGQVVLSGDAEGISCFQNKMSGTKMIELAVSAPFHSSLMRPAADNLKIELSKTNFSVGKFPVISNFAVAIEAEPENIRSSLYNQVCGRVRWVESMNYAVAHYAVTDVVEFGSGNVLTGLAKRIKPDLARTNLNSADNFA